MVVQEFEASKDTRDTLSPALSGSEWSEVKTEIVHEIIKDEPLKAIDGFPLALLERYEPLELLGKGGFVRVYKVRRKSDNKIVALKIPMIDERTSSFFIKEVAAWYNLNHENIVHLYKADILPCPHLEMEFVGGI